MPGTQIIPVNLRALLGYDALWDLEVEPLPTGLYRIAEIPFGGATPFEIDVQYRDIVELIRDCEGRYELRSVRERGGWKRFDFLLSADYVGSKDMERWLSEAQAAGGTWIREAGGLVTMMLPPDSDWDPRASSAAGRQA
jgi:hypothetical protein